MSDKKTKVECRLTTRGTAKIEADAAEDLKVPDPDKAIGEQAIGDATEEDTNNGSKSDNPR